MVKHIFGSDRPLLYNVEPWAGLGFAVPNFANQIGTLNNPVWRLADEMSKAQLLLTTHIDAQRTQYPSINTVKRIGKMFNRCSVVLSNRQKSSPDHRLEERHANADLRPWQIHPVPFFTSSIVQNSWISEYNHLCMIALTNIYQHSDNNLALTVTTEFAQEIFEYFLEIAILMGTELLGLQKSVIVAPGFQFDDTSYLGYATIASRVLSFEPLDSAGPIQSRATELDLHAFFVGIPANMVVTSLAEYPAGPGGLASQGVEVPGMARAPGSEGAAVGDNVGHIGQPQV